MDEVQVAKAIRTAIKAGESGKVFELIDNDPDRLNMDTPFGSWLHVASSHGKTWIVKLLIGLGADINARGGTAGGTPIHRAASDGHIDVVRFLLSCGAELDVSEPERNPLFGAIHWGHVDIVKLLIENGIDARVKYTGTRMKNMDALAFARERGQTKIAEFLETCLGKKGAGKARKQPSIKNHWKRRKKTHVDFDLLRQRVTKAARRTFDAVRTAHPTESFYAFALYAADDAVGINPSANSTQAYKCIEDRVMADESQKKWLKSHGISLKRFLLGDYYWSAYSWEYQCAKSKGFDAVNKLINNRGVGRYDSDDPLGFVKFKSGVFASMVLALRDLNDEGYFGKGADRKSVTIFCSVPNSECSAWLEQDSARRLNPPTVFKIFAEERIKYIADGSNRRRPAPDSVQAFYLSFVEKG